MRGNSVHYYIDRIFVMQDYKGELSPINSRYIINKNMIKYKSFG